MSGHSKWAGIKHKKAANDAKRGKIWTKIVREITLAAKISGGDPGGNPRLRKAIDDAKASNMPADNIKRAVQKGTGELPGAEYVELTFEGYGPGGVAVYCEGSTDNRNRTTNEIRKIYENNGGNMGQPGAVAFLFDRKAYFTVKKGAITEDALMDLLLELGGEDLKTEDDIFEVLGAPESFDALKDGLQAKGIATETAEISMLPKTTVACDKQTAEKNLKLIEELEDHDDISKVFANFDIPEEILASLDA
ncbi:MAG: transcriptional regulator [Elusimicrobia bacterium CG1_02_63_36]|nr:MAG: transcriptional regulator [Elusimicrobia bacterium CG1_02_63_36]PIP81971.1 MAG: YebC/PmpR family DNA-binding transcriptional regulator [Elusimicrobia bacterium CG22_combo_CG10-13_8_21_14_all_63_91]PJA18470.1 MAG: YebC/PmpR family DNA-binding transcriptional regulator [Elusimicrobia bacterium CG_4_10_14_0_2_um_filter_63_34]PJB24507.1 MAG: YebC/PmpR family DNA-binding transcriptional regulator [Elusimicrobia bacterium CG_4_9_14_3_um_filter_62_55]